MNRQVISARGISKVFYNQNSSLEVLKDISFDLDKGQSIGIVGASGSGKTTLLHIVCGLENPNSGEVLVNGKEISSLSFDEKALLRSKEIGFVYQFHHLLPDLTALENVLMPALIAGIPQALAIENAKRLLGDMNLENKENNKPDELSGGERQRVAIARSMSNSPSCLVMDEPTGNLDTNNVESFMNLVLEIVRKKEIGLIVASHDQNVFGRLDNILSLE